MKRRFQILFGLAAVSFAGSLRADNAAIPRPSTPLETPFGDSASRDGPIDRTHVTLGELLSDTCLALSYGDFDRDGLRRWPLDYFRTRPDSAAIRELPAAPDSAQLFLSALVSVAAWQLVRGSRGLHAGLQATWCHTGEPMQIGHRIAVDNLDFAVAPLVFPSLPPSDPLCGPVHIAPCGGHGRQFDTILGPRAPPFC